MTENSIVKNTRKSAGTHL